MTTIADVTIDQILDLGNGSLRISGQIAGLYPLDAYETRYSQDELEWQITKDAVRDENEHITEPEEGQWIPKEGAEGTRVLKDGAELNKLSFDVPPPPSWEDYTDQHRDSLLEWAKTILLTIAIPAENIEPEGGVPEPRDLGISG